MFLVLADGVYLRRFQKSCMRNKDPQGLSNHRFLLFVTLMSPQAIIFINQRLIIVLYILSHSIYYKKCLRHHKSRLSKITYINMAYIDFLMIVGIEFHKPCIFHLSLPYQGNQRPWSMHSFDINLERCAFSFRPV